MVTKINMESARAEANKVTAESVDATRRMVEIVTSCEDIEAHSLGKLAEQEAQLNEIEETLQKQDHVLKKGDKVLKNIEINEKVPCFLAPCFRFYNSFKAKRETTKEKKMVKNTRNFDDHCWTQQAPSTFSSNLNKCDINKREEDSKSRFFERITGGPSEDEIESNLKQVESCLKIIKTGAIEIGVTVEKSISQIERITEAAETQDSKMNEMTNKTKELNKII